MKTLKDKVIVITGASSGIGEAMAREYAARGAKVVLGARSVQKLQLLAGEIRRHGGQAAYCGVDVTQPEECRGLIDTAVSSVAGLHGLPGRTGYSASKYAMTGFLETLRIENLRKGLHVMIACPGFTASNVRFSALTADGSQQGETPRDESKMMSPVEVARIVERGILRRKRLCLMEAEGRATHFVKKFAPAFLDRMFYMVMAREPDSPLR